MPKRNRKKRMYFKALFSPASRCSGLGQKMRGRGRLFVLFWFLATFWGSAYGERADRDQPIQLEADEAQVNQSKRMSVFTGNVVLTQGTLSIRANKLVVQEDAEGFKTGTAFGNPAVFRQKREGANDYIEGRGERLEYDTNTEKLQIFNRAYLKRGRDEVQGNYISYDAHTEYFQVSGGGSTTSAEGQSKGRVRAIIQPKTTGTDHPAPAGSTSTQSPEEGKSRR